MSTLDSEFTVSSNGSSARTSAAPRSGLSRALGRLDRRQAYRLGLIALVIVLVGTATAFVTSLWMPAQYAARSDLLYVITREQPTGFLREDRNLTTQLVLLRSRTVLDPVAAAVDMPVDELETRVTASVVPESEVIHVELRDRDPARATEMLGMVVANYLAVSNNDRRAAVQRYLDGELRGVLGRLDTLPPDAAERAPLVEREQSLRTRLDELKLADLAGPAAEVLQPAYADSDPVSPNRALAAATGGLAGLLVAVVVVAVLGRRMTRRPGPE